MVRRWRLIGHFPVLYYPLRQDPELPRAHSTNPLALLARRTAPRRRRRRRCRDRPACPRRRPASARARRPSAARAGRHSEVEGERESGWRPTEADTGGGTVGGTVRERWSRTWRCSSDGTGRSTSTPSPCAAAARLAADTVAPPRSASRAARRAGCTRQRQQPPLPPLQR